MWGQSNTRWKTCGGSVTKGDMGTMADPRGDGGVGGTQTRHRGFPLPPPPRDPKGDRKDLGGCKQGLQRTPKDMGTLKRTQ